jgi:AraC-like DNA-binding protein
MPPLFMWLSPDRVFYRGLLGATAVRTMGAVMVYSAYEGTIRVQVAQGPWQLGKLAVVPACTPHRIQAESRVIDVVQLEAETLHEPSLPYPLQAQGIVEDRALVGRIRSECIALQGAHCSDHDFDRLFFEQPLAIRPMDPRIARIVEQVKHAPASPLSAEECATQAQLSFSRFLHLFKQEVGQPFRSFRTWKRARALLHHVHSASNLAYVALDTGYPDSTHFSHSIRQIYGLKPKDIVAGSRRLRVIPA